MSDIFLNKLSFAPLNIASKFFIQCVFPVFIEESAETWKWEKNSKEHREMITRLLKHGKEHPEEIKEINGVRVCCTKDFVIGRGCDGTRTYVGLAKDGYEKAVKRLHRDTCELVAEQEKDILNQPSATTSNHVVKYWYLDDESDKEYLYLILDLCEENLEKYVARTKLDQLVKEAPSIIQQVLKGLVDLHSNSQPILHRDIKPHNILRDVHNNWLLADFGISRLMSATSNTYRSKQMGTPDWRAVESYHSDDNMTDKDVRYKKESDIQVRICEKCIDMEMYRRLSVWYKRSRNST